MTRKFHVVVVQNSGKEMLKKSAARANFVVVVVVANRPFYSYEWKRG